MRTVGKPVHCEVPCGSPPNQGGVGGLSHHKTGGINEGPRVMRILPTPAHVRSRFKREVGWWTRVEGGLNENKWIFGDSWGP